MDSGSFPKIDFTTFILSVSSAAMMHLGITPPDSDLEPTFDFDIAKQNIDLLELMLEKTKGNRTGDEDRLLSELLFQTRMRFVEVCKEKQT